MRRVLGFIKTTLLGGLVVILPIVAVVVLLRRAVAFARAALTPIVGAVPGGFVHPGLVASALVLGVCFLTGLLLRTTAAQRALHGLEQRVLERLPAYSVFRSLSRRILGQEEGPTFAAALAVIEGALVPAFIVEVHQDGRYTVFVPTAPTPVIGAIYILPPERVHRVDVPFHKAVGCVTRWGAGAEDLCRAVRRP
jgi:uncharacterized membrane protein